MFRTDEFRWHILFDTNIHDISQARFDLFRKLDPPPAIFWADPFVISENDQYYIFVEEFVYSLNKAHISVLTIDECGNFLSSAKIIDREYHMSYPFIFKHENYWYMIPETSKNKTIQLYKCQEFPYKWKFEKNLMENVIAKDSTLFFYDDLWWLFTSIDQTDNISGAGTELFLFYTDNFLNGKWRSHPLNPVVSDARKARPAGKIFMHEGRIFRPSQDCAGRYGKSFSINEIVRLTENEYEEFVVTSVYPLWDKKLLGTHTFNSHNDISVIDAYSYRNRFSIINSK
jgi:hypothetical protein